MHYIAIKITQIIVFYVIIRAPTCFDPPGYNALNINSFVLTSTDMLQHTLP